MVKIKTVILFLIIRQYLTTTQEFIRGDINFCRRCNSTNGVFVNGVAVRGTKEIHEKDTIQIGLQLIVFSCETLICKTETEGIQLTMCDL